MINPYVDGLIRHVLTGVGGLLVMKGLTDDATVTTVVGAVLTVVGFVASVINKKNAAKA